MVTIGVITVVVGLILPGLGGGRSTARRIVAQSNIRQIGVLNTLYMDAYRSSPAAYPPRRAPSATGYHEATTPYGTLRGVWFQNTAHYQYLLDERIADDVLVAPNNPTPDPGVYRLSDYDLTDTLYAIPSYWDRDSQRGQAQWKSLTLDAVAYPSAKGFMLQRTVYLPPAYPDGLPACCAEDTRSAVLWCDLSASEEIQGLLHPGAPNFYDERSTATVGYWDDGAPIRSTSDGLNGRDR